MQSLIILEIFCTIFIVSTSAQVELLPSAEMDYQESTVADNEADTSVKTPKSCNSEIKLKKCIEHMIQDQLKNIRIQDAHDSIKIGELKKEIEVLKFNFEETSQAYHTRIDRLYEMMYCQRDLMASVFERLNFDNSQTLTWGADMTEFVANFSRYKCMPRDCMEILFSGQTESGNYNIYPDQSTSPIQVYCDMNSKGGGWTMIMQRGKDPMINFAQSWLNYENGFGNLSGEHFIGLQNLYTLVKSHDQVLRVDLSDWEGSSVYAQYEKFGIDGPDLKYKLSVGDYSGDAGDSFSQHNGFQFTTYDQDNDEFEENCAIHFGGGWWYDYCFDSNLMGKYYNSSGVAENQGLQWYEWKKNMNYSLKTAEMRIRNVNFYILRKQIFPKREFLE